MVKLALLITVCLFAAFIFVSTLIVIFSLAFWLKNNSRFSSRLKEVMYIFCSIPQHSQDLAVKVIMFTVMPSGFIGLLPVQLIQHFNLGLFLVLVVAAVIYLFLAIAIFNRGLNYYQNWA